MKKPYVIDDFMHKKEFNELQSWVMGRSIQWQYCDCVVDPDNVGDSNPDAYQFVHSLYISSMGFYNEEIMRLKDLFTIINPQVLLKCKLNLQPKTIGERRKNDFHTDFTPPLPGWTTAIFYLNTNNGYTEFECDGSKIDSVANRIVFFDGTMRHRGTTCTDAKNRYVLNLNFNGGTYAQ